MRCCPSTIVNNGADECLVNALQISAGAVPPRFSLPDYPAGASTSMVIAAANRWKCGAFRSSDQQANFTGPVAFTISNRRGLTGHGPGGQQIWVAS